MEFPLAAPPSRTASVELESSAVDPTTLRILMVDDNVDMVMLLGIALRKRGYSVRSAYTGSSGLEIAHQWRPDVVLLDIGLPELDGYEVARRLRADPTPGHAGRAMRLIALTGYGRETDLSSAQKAGFDGHLTKPVEFKDLERAIAGAPGLIGRHRESEGAA